MSAVSTAPIRYSFDDLRLGMEVKRSELSEIFGKVIILINTVLLPDNDIEGEVAYLDNGDNEEYEKWFMQDEIPITPIFQSEDMKDGIECDE